MDFPSGVDRLLRIMTMPRGQPHVTIGPILFFETLLLVSFFFFFVIDFFFFDVEHF